MDPILATIERSNQRGGRMLSVVDLIETDTLDAHRAAWLITRIERGSSFFVGAKPGGAGKTTVMGALLAHLPEGEAVRLTNPDTGWEDSHPGDCVVAYEIGRGSYDAYAWGADVARMGELARTGVRVVTNLHADTLEQACGQIVDDCGASPEGFEALGIFIPLEIKGNRVLGETAGGGNPASRRRDMAGTRAETVSHTTGNSHRGVPPRASQERCRPHRRSPSPMARLAPREPAFRLTRPKKQPDSHPENASRGPSLPRSVPEVPRHP